ncbi:putative ankyrin repeat protein RF_0381 [Physella acuta]|uniref:putative ankyrin repeat protein RF_0381 n=1 Tax=Physella acuta TaxID=109671 RepID=UPI0027DCBA20|nr:putative ankyrin repeat protein RF_0381 [Physella acuta]
MSYVKRARQLLQKAKAGKPEALLKLIKSKNISINCLYPDGTTLLTSAAEKYGISSILTLLQSGADLNIQNIRGDTALMLALRRQKMDVVKFLINAGIDVNLVNQSGETALSLACSTYGLEQCVLLLMKAGAKLVAQEKLNLHMERCITILWSMGAINKKDGVGKTALMYVTEIGLANCLDILLKKKSFGGGVSPVNKVANNKSYVIGEACRLDVDVKDTFGKTALMYATLCQWADMFCTQLIQAGADINAKDSLGVSVLMYAISGKTTQNFCERLVQCVLDINAKDEMGRNILYYAISSKRSTGFCRFLIQHGVDVNSRDKDGNTALMYSIALGQASMELCETLLSVGAEVNLANHANQTALMLSIVSDHADSGVSWCCDYWSASEKFRVSYLLLEVGSDPVVDMIRKEYLLSFYMGFSDNFLNWVIERKQVLRLMVCNGIVPSFIQGHENFNRNFPTELYSPLMFALQSGQVDIVKYLIVNCCVSTTDLRVMNSRCRKSMTKHSMHLYNRIPVESRKVLDDVTSQPWPLVKLCFVTVSTLIGLRPGREERLRRTRLPNVLQRMLLFQGPMAYIPVTDWPDIPVFFDPDEYSRTPRPLPLMNYWPVGHVYS